MHTQLRALFKAIVADNRTLVRSLLKAHPTLASAPTKEPRLEMKISHWIYVGDTALHVAAAAYRIEIAKQLLAAGADPNAAMNHRRGRPLHYAADGTPCWPDWITKRQVAMIRLLLDAGADIDAQDKNGATALHRAVRTRCAAAVKFLLDAGANPTAFNKPGSTPFHLTVQDTGRGGSGTPEARAAQIEIIQTFLNHGIKSSLKNAKGQSVVELAVNKSLADVFRVKPGHRPSVRE